MDKNYFFLASGCSFLLGIICFCLPFKLCGKKDFFRKLLAAALFLTALWAGTYDISRVITFIASPILRFIIAGIGALMSCLTLIIFGCFSGVNISMTLEKKTLDMIDLVFWLSYLIPLIVGYIFFVPCFFMTFLAGIISLVIILGFAFHPEKNTRHCKIK